MASRNVLSTFLLAWLRFINGQTSSGFFTYFQSRNGMVCGDPTLLASYTGISLFRCITMCHRSEHQSCVAVFYKEHQGRCFLCDSIALPRLQTSGGTVAWKKKDCSDYLVSAAEDGQLTESSTIDNIPTLHSAVYARLNTVETVDGTGCWLAAMNDPSPYIQVDFLEPKRVTGVVTLGRSREPFHFRQWVTEYYVKVSSDCSSWRNVVDRTGSLQYFPGNTDEETHVTNLFDLPLETRCVRVYPTEYHNLRSLRFDVLGCDL